MIGEGCTGNTLGEYGSGLFNEEFSWRAWERPLTASVSLSNVVAKIRKRHLPD